MKNATKQSAKEYFHNGFAAIYRGVAKLVKARDFDSRIVGSNPAIPAKGITMPLYGNLLVPVCKNVGSRPYFSFGQESCKPYRAIGLYRGPRLLNLE